MSGVSYRFHPKKILSQETTLLIGTLLKEASSFDLISSLSLSMIHSLCSISSPRDLFVRFEYYPKERLLSFLSTTRTCNSLGNRTDLSNFDERVHVKSLTGKNQSNQSYEQLYPIGG